MPDRNRMQGKTRVLLLGLAFGVCAVPARASDIVQVDYLCERGARIPATYLNVTEPNLLLLQVEGQQIVFGQTISGSGIFYRQAPEGKAGYFWRSKGDWAMLSWIAADGAETDLLSDCQATGPTRELPMPAVPKLP